MLSAQIVAVRSIKSVFFILSPFGESKFLSDYMDPGNNLLFLRFKCDACHKSAGTNKKENRFTAKRLQTTRLGSYIETRVNNFLRKKEADAGDVHIRVVFSGDKQVEVKPGMKHR